MCHNKKAHVLQKAYTHTVQTYQTLCGLQLTMDIQGGENHPAVGRYSPTNLKCQQPKISRKYSKSAIQNFLDVLEG